MDQNIYLKNSKWVSTVASIWIQCTSGSLYTFSIYSQTLKSTQHYDQSTLDIVSVSKDIGANIGVLSGVIYDCWARPNASWAIFSCGLLCPVSFRRCRCRCRSCVCLCLWLLMLRVTLILLTLLLVFVTFLIIVEPLLVS
jgi:hypothetical protein